MARLEGAAMQTAFKRAFGIDIANATPEMARFVMAVAKHTRRFCKSNAALYNYIIREFGSLKCKKKRIKIVSKFGPTRGHEIEIDVLDIQDGLNRKELKVNTTLSAEAVTDQDDDGDE